MDYLIFSSRFSPSCQKVLDEFPGALSKIVMIDSKSMRDYAKKLKIVCVPTLIVILGDKIIERIVGFESIQNWLLIAIYRSNQLQMSTTIPSEDNMSYSNPNPIAPSAPSSVQYPTSTVYSLPIQQQHLDASPPQQPQHSQQQEMLYETTSLHSVQPISPSSGQTNLDDLILDEVAENPIGIGPKGSSPMNTIQLAEAMKKERDNSFEKGKKSINFERN